jgi:hypothetical protein
LTIWLFSQPVLFCHHSVDDFFIKELYGYYDVLIRYIYLIINLSV